MVSSFQLRHLFAFLFVIVAFFGIVHTVSAQAQAGIGIRPAIVEEIADPGGTLQYEFVISNLSEVDQTYYFFVRDIIGADDAGAPIFAREAYERTGYEIADWIELNLEEQVIPAGGEAVLNATIRVPEDASPGSHFGGVFVSMQPPRLRQTGASVGYEVASIVSLRIAGDVVENGVIRSLSTGNFMYGSLEIDFRARIENTGNTLIRPFGPLEITNMFGSRVATLSFNESKAGIFPGNTREYTIDWTGEGPGFGRYRADLSLIYGPQGRQQTMSNSVTFWVLPMNIILPALGVLTVLLLSVYFGVRMYVRNQLQRVAGVSRRRVAKRGGDPSAFMLILIAMLTVTALFLVLLLVLFA
jgi:hypothetical protein